MNQQEHNNEPRDAAVRRHQQEAGRKMSGARPPVKRTQAKEEIRGHEALLKTLEVAGAEISIDLRDVDYPVVGKVKRSDKYTISLEVKDGEGARTRVIFKAAMIGFTVMSESPYQQKKKSDSTAE